MKTHKVKGGHLPADITASAIVYDDGGRGAGYMTDAEDMTLEVDQNATPDYTQSAQRRRAASMDRIEL